MSMLLTSPDPTRTDDRFTVVSQPRPGTVVELSPGSQLAVTFRRGLGPSRWHVAGLPGHLVMLSDAGHEFRFLVFGGDEGAAPVRFERRHPDREIAHEVCELLVVPVSEAADRAAGRAPARTA
jgi:hypothetical protein